MSDNTRAAAAIVVGGIVGAVAGYMFFTDKGRQLRRQLEPALEDMTRELNHFRGTVNKAAGVASEGWQLLNDAFGDRGDQRYPNTPQTSPF